MCSYQEWERFSRGCRDAVDEDEVREFVRDATARVEFFVEELKRRVAAHGNRDWVCQRGGRAPAEWV